MKNKALRTTAITALTIYLVTFLTGALGTALAFLLGHLGILTMDRLWVAPLLPILTSLLLGTVMTKELQSTEILRHDFIQNVSHEFKTPLAAIEGYAALLQQPDLTAEQRQLYTQQIITSTRRLNGLSENLLLSRLEQQQLRLQKETFSLDEQLRENILLTEPIWSKKDISLIVELADCTFTVTLPSAPD